MVMFLIYDWLKIYSEIRCFNISIAELHEQRVTQLRNLEKKLDEDNWKYPSIENIIGLK